MQETNSLSGARLESMLVLQDGINTRINVDWRGAGNPWYRAIWTECSELMDHIGWKWWKRQEPDMAQIHLELVDILHFGLSELLQLHCSARAAATCSIGAYEEYATARPGQTDVATRLSLVETFASESLSNRSFDLRTFGKLAAAFELAELSLFEKYVGKNVLNTFRQDHGYRDGTYQKIWSGREDNEWLSEIASGIPKDASTFSEELYRQLSSKYREVSVGR
ncbi:dUTP diphosphatase [Burkholderia contaminans]|uniref:dUTP diphosphatase n=1 Tax=Burkholderia contaminans TaxID=488447 RepID=A0A3N8PT22_9BURK|nr:dUTP diphosphatase [Burkholderia contaminans]RQT14807.1 dUTP diphosphatase [Burkholderia contaminans]